MSDEPDLGDFDDEFAVQMPPDPDQVFRDALMAAMTPKPTIKEMIEAVTMARADIEDPQIRLLYQGTRTEPYKPYMRRAAVLAATANFLSLVEANQDAVKRALRGSR